VHATVEDNIPKCVMSEVCRKSQLNGR
jgi:hypothetical protein